jgi:hypothetical protein
MLEIENKDRFGKVIADSLIKKTVRSVAYNIQPFVIVDYLQLHFCTIFQ